MKLNDAYKNWIENPCEETYEDLGKALLLYTRLETKRQFKTKTNKTEREDISGECLIRIFSKIDRFNKESTFATWVFRIIFNEGERFLGNRAKLYQQGLVGNESHDPGPSLIDKISLKQLVVKLDKEDQYLVKLKLEGLEDEEIAKELGISRDASAKRWERIQMKLRTLAGGLNDHGGAGVPG